MFPGGFSAGDEPEGSAKFFATAFRNEKLKENKNCGNISDQTDTAAIFMNFLPLLLPALKISVKSHFKYFAQSGENFQINSGYLILTVVVNWVRCKIAVFADGIFADSFFFHYYVQNQ